jgi:hypothetical protein
MKEKKRKIKISNFNSDENKNRSQFRFGWRDFVGFFQLPDAMVTQKSRRNALAQHKKGTIIAHICFLRYLWIYLAPRNNKINQTRKIYLFSHCSTISREPF